VDESAPVRTRYRVEVDLRLRERLKDGERVQVHHGTRSTPARARQQGSRWQLRLERPLLSAPGDRVVLRRLNPPATLGGGVVLEAAERPVLRPPKPLHTEQPALLTPGALALEQRLRAAGHKPPTVTELGDAAVHLPLLRAHRRAVRVGRVMYAHPDAISAVRRTAEHIIKEEGAMSLARLRDELGISRRHALALLEHLDAARITLRREDDSRVLRRPVTIRSP
jgi:selenocysteine-specific elongation factor